jgi:hypothetical protein
MERIIYEKLIHDDRRAAGMASEIRCQESKIGRREDAVDVGKCVMPLRSGSIIYYMI